MHPTLFVVSIVIKLEPESVIGTCPWPEHGLPHTGEFTDGFGNLVYVYAVALREWAILFQRAAAERRQDRHDIHGTLGFYETLHLGYLLFRHPCVF